MTVRERPHFVLKPTELAGWLDQEPEKWWIVDGDPRLTGEVDFPCPAQELSEVLRRHKKDLFLYPLESKSIEPQPVGQPIECRRLDEIADRDNLDRRRIFAFSWADRDDEWLLVEYPSRKISELRD